MNPPTKLLERYSELYDNEWTDAYEECTVAWNMDEETCVKTMLDLLKVCYIFNSYLYLFIYCIAFEIFILRIVFHFVTHALRLYLLL